MKQDGHEDLQKNSVWRLLLRPYIITEKQQLILLELIKYNLWNVKDYLYRRAFLLLCAYLRVAWAGKFLNKWFEMINQTNLAPPRKIAASIIGHLTWSISWFKAKKSFHQTQWKQWITKIIVVSRRVYGYWMARITQLALLHNLKDLPEPNHFQQCC